MMIKEKAVLVIWKYDGCSGKSVGTICFRTLWVDELSSNTEFLSEGPHVSSNHSLDGSSSEALSDKIDPQSSGQGQDLARRFVVIRSVPFKIRAPGDWDVPFRRSFHLKSNVLLLNHYSLAPYWQLLMACEGNPAFGCNFTERRNLRYAP